MRSKKMASSFHCFFIVSMALVSQFLMGSSLASTPYIDKLCSQEFIDDKPFCLQTLSAYPSAVSANGSLPLAEAAILGIVQPQAKKAATFAAAQKDPIFKECHQAYVDLQKLLSDASDELKRSSDGAVYVTMICYDDTDRVKDLIGKKKDAASKTLMQMTIQMDKLLRIAVAATEAVFG